MTREEKSLLLQDLCARLPYGVKFQYIICDFCEPNVLEDVDVKREQIITEEVSRYDIEEIKPYLRSMSSMTEEEAIYYDTVYTTLKFYQKEDWLNAHHFDYRGLIPMGLGIDCTGLNIYENE